MAISAPDGSNPRLDPIEQCGVPRPTGAGTPFVMNANLTLREGPSRSCTSLGFVPVGSTVTVYDQRITNDNFIWALLSHNATTAWVAISFPDGSNPRLDPVAACSVPRPAGAGTPFVMNANLTLREGPSRSCTSLGFVPVGFHGHGV